MQKSGASVRNGSRLCENSRVHFARRKFFSIWSICKPKLLTTAIRGRQKRNRFYALLAHARFHGPGSTAVHPDPVGNRQRWVVTRHSADRRGPTRLPRFPPFASSHLRIAGVRPESGRGLMLCPRCCTHRPAVGSLCARFSRGCGCMRTECTVGASLPCSAPR